MSAAAARQPAPPERPPSTSLFRPEALEARKAQAFGVVLIEPKLSQSVFACGALAASVAVAALLIFGSYTRKAQVNGWLTPSAGLVRVHTPQTGVVTRLFVQEGEHVEAGAPLMRISGEMHDSALVAVKAQAVASIGDEEASLRDARNVNGKLFDQQADDLGARLAAIRSEERQIAEELSLQRERADLAERALARMRAMRQRDLVPLPRLEQAQQDRLDQAMRLKVVEQRRLALERERDQLEQTAREVPLRKALQIGEVDRSLSQAQEKYAEASAQREITLTAPQGGTVTDIQAEGGGAVSPSAPLLGIVPDGVDLQAQLFVPSRAAGFVHTGQHVLLRYQPYPYQRFGAYEGVVESVSRSALSPSEVPQRLTGLSSLIGSNEGFYLVAVRLDQQFARAYGKTLPLKPGMQLEADVLLENRRLIEWVLDPLYAMTGSWR